MVYRSALSAFVLSLGAAPLAGQLQNEFCRGNSRLTVGQWSSYRYVGGSSDGSSVRMAIVGSEKQGDSTFLWYEVKIDDSRHPDRGSTITQALVSGLGTPTFSVHGVIMKAGNQPAMQPSGMMVQMMAGPIKKGFGSMLEQKCKKGALQEVGWETVQVSGGTFKALHFRDGDDDAWVSRDLAFPLVKYVSKSAGTMELTGHGADAKSSITETPQKMGP